VVHAVEADPGDGVDSRRGVSAVAGGIPVLVTVAESKQLLILWALRDDAWACLLA